MDVKANLQKIKKRIWQAELKFQRVPDSVRLLVVSKTQSAEMIEAAYNAGQRSFGESYLQEALEKQLALSHCDIEWHFIGSIQSNKTKSIATHFDWVHSIDRVKIAKRLNEQRSCSRHQLPLNICVEVNINHEDTKSGVAPENLRALVSEISELNHLRLRGLMAIPQHFKHFDEQKAVFEKVSALQNDLIDEGCRLDTLSMGMSQDFEAAIAAGSTMVRVGTAIFGERLS